MGICRAVILEEMPMEKAYRQATVKILTDLEPSAGDCVMQHMAGELADCLRKRVAGAESLIHDFLKGEISMGRLTDIIAFHLPLETKVKLQLLSRANVLERAETLVEQLTLPSKPRKTSGTFPPEFSPN
jgi:ATP-dependent Lon protease